MTVKRNAFKSGTCPNHPKSTEKKEGKIGEYNRAGGHEVIMGLMGWVTGDETHKAQTS